MNLFDDLSDIAKFRVSLILQGTQSGVGAHINWLKFSSNPEEKKAEIESFIDLINRKFRGLVQLIETEDYIVPLIKNHKAEDYFYRILSNDAIALSLVILLHRFYNSSGPSLKMLEEKLTGTALENRKITSLLKKLEYYKFIIRKEIEGVEFYEPTTVLKACAAFDLILKILSKVYKNTQDQIILNFFPDPEYVNTQNKVGNKMTSVPEYLKEIDNSGEEVNNTK